MKLDMPTILAMIKRKGVTALAFTILGAVICAEDDQTRDLIKHYVAEFGGTGTALAIVSWIMSQNRELKVKEDINVALNTPSPEQQKFSTPQDVKS